MANILLSVKYVFILWLYIDKNTHTNIDTISHRNYKPLEYIIVDRFQDVGKYKVYRRNEILKTPEQLVAFGCRPKPPHRSI